MYDSTLMFIRLGSCFTHLLPGFCVDVIAHTWSVRSFNVFGMMERFLRNGLHSRYDFIAFGCMLHYIEDFFTYPHNERFRGSLREHVRYEKTLHRYLTRSADLAEGLDDMCKPLAPTLPERLSELHDSYQSTQSGVQTDLTYIMEAAGMTSAVILSNVRVGQTMGETEQGMVPLCGQLSFADADVLAGAGIWTLFRSGDTLKN